MFKRRILLLTALVCAMCVPRPAMAAAPMQAPVFDNLFLLLGAVLLALLSSIVGGVVVTALAMLVSQFLRRNLPTDEEMLQLRSEWNRPPKRVNLRLTLTPNREPIVLTLIGLVVFFILSAIVVSSFPQPVEGAFRQDEGADGAAPATSQGLPREGDFGSIIDGLPEGDPARGERLFVSAGCSGCHSQIKDQRLVGPSFYNLWDIAATRVPGMSAKEYLYQSIVDPNAYIVEGYQPGLMQQNYAAILSPQQMADILAWIEQRHSNEP